MYLNVRVIWVGFSVLISDKSRMDHCHRSPWPWIQPSSVPVSVQVSEIASAKSSERNLCQFDTVQDMSAHHVGCLASIEICTVEKILRASHVQRNQKGAKRQCETESAAVNKGPNDVHLKH